VVTGYGHHVYVCTGFGGAGMKTVMIAGATGYLGRYLVRAFQQRGYRVRALVRDLARAQQQGLQADEWLEAEATQTETLKGGLDGVDWLVSSLGLTRQGDGLSYTEVDYQANLNLLNEALSAAVQRVAYIHVLAAESMPAVPLVAAKQAYVKALQAAPVASTVMAPSGFFSDMQDFLSMAQQGRVWLFGDGSKRLNPIHGADLALATVDAMEQGRQWVDIGGPEVFTQRELAELAFASLGKTPKISFLPDAIRRWSLPLLPWFLPRHWRGPAQFFLTALGQNMVGEIVGHHRLLASFKAQQNQPSANNRL